MRRVIGHLGHDVGRDGMRRRDETTGVQLIEMVGLLIGARLVEREDGRDVGRNLGRDVGRDDSRVDGMLVEDLVG